MDFRQYDNALGRFHGVDLLAEVSYSQTPYHFGLNNPVYFSDPTGLIQGGPILNAMWDNTPAGTNSQWINDGFGNFDNADGTSFISKEGNFFLSSQFDVIGGTSGGGGGGSSDISLNGIILNNVIVYGNSSTWLSQIQQHVYDNSPYYDAYRYSYKGLGYAEYLDEGFSAVAAHTKRLKHGGGYVAISGAKSGKGLYFKPNARGLNNIKGTSFNVSKGFNTGGFAVGILLEAPEIYYGYETSTYEGSKQVVCSLGLAGFETGPGVILTVFVGAAVGGYPGEEGVERAFDGIFKDN